MKWFNLSLLLVGIALVVVLVVEPTVLNNLGSVKSARNESLPVSLESIQTIDELSMPLALIPRPSTDLELPTGEPPAVQVGQAQTQKLENVVLVTEELETPAANAEPGPLQNEATSQPEPTELVPPETINEPEPALSCYRYGPLKDFKQVEAAGELLVNQNLTTEWAEIEAPYTDVRYWVVLDEARTRQQARNWVQKLDDKKFGDHYLSLSGKEPYLISLGIFKSVDRAERHQASLQGNGFPVKVRTKPIEQSRRWVQFDAALDTKPALTEAIAVLGVSNAQIESCPAASN